MATDRELIFAKGKLISFYEDKFILSILRNYASRKERVPTPTGNFKDYYSDIISGALERVVKGLNTQRPKSKRTNKQEIALEDVVADRYSVLLKPEFLKKTYRTWQEYFADAFDGREDYLGYMKKISEAYVKLCPKDELAEPYNKLGIVINGIAKSLANEIFGDPNVRPISSGYDISYKLFKDDGNGFKSTDKEGIVNAGLTDSKQNTYLGRSPREGSVFSNLQPIFVDDVSVSKEHFFLQETADGLVLNDISVNGTAGKDYQGVKFELERENKSKRDPLPQLLVDIDHKSNKSFGLPIRFGGDKQNKYQLDLKFNVRIKI